jgi:hypothetical protein
MSQFYQSLTLDQRAATAAARGDWSEVVRLSVSEKDAEIERLRAALKDVVDWADELGRYAEKGTTLAPVFQRAKDVLEGK